jgi:hypothetical protein
MNEEHEKAFRDLADRVLCPKNPRGKAHCSHPRVRRGDHGPYAPIDLEVELVCCWCGATDVQPA